MDGSNSHQLREQQLRQHAENASSWSPQSRVNRDDYRVEAVMVLPGAEHAVIETSKLRDYLLSQDHPVGRLKAVFFRALGYTKMDWMRLERDLLELCHRGDVSEGRTTAFGCKYEVRGTLVGPSGRYADVVTVWMVPAGEAAPRIVTAYPG
jgi:hypothetical protein